MKRLAFEKADEIDALAGDKYDFVLLNKASGENVRGLEDPTMPARKADKTSKPAVSENGRAHGGTRRSRHDAAGSHDRQGKPREGSGWRQAGF